MTDPSSADLGGRVALVTGASYGIGRGIAEALAARGATILLTDVNDRVEATAAEMRTAGATVATTRMDVRDRESVRAGIGLALSRFGRLDILVNNAAAARTSKPILEMEPEDWDGHMEINVRGNLWCMQAAVPAMARGGKGGRIVNIASTAGLHPYKRRAHYCTSKSAIIALTRVAALEFAEHGITVNCVAPGQTETENQKMMAAGVLDAKEGEEMRRRLAARPLGPGKPEDVAAAVVFFASPAARQVTGQLVVVDGGTLLN